MSNPYSTLCIEKTATMEEVKRAYKTQALQWHPDKNNSDDAAAKFKDVSHAFAILSNPESRRRYDDTGLDEKRSNPFDFHSMFASMFQHEQRMTEDDVINVGVSLKEVREGCVKHIEFEQPDKCASCAGCGADSFRTCSTCAGKGRISIIQIPGTPIMMHVPNGGPCMACKGIGVQAHTPSGRCKECAGQGVTYKKRGYDVRIAPGVADGHVVIMRGKGGMSDTGGHLDAAIRFRHTFENGVSLDATTGDVTLVVDLTLEEVVCGFERQIKLSHMTDDLTVSSRAYRNPTESMVFHIHNSSLVVKFNVVYPEDLKLIKYKDVFMRIFSSPKTL